VRVRVEVSLQDDGGGDTVDDPSSLFPAYAALTEKLLRLGGGEGFVPADDGERKARLQPPDEPVDLLALDPFRAIEPMTIRSTPWRLTRSSITPRSASRFLLAMVATPWAVIPSSSQMATPILRLP
jgi:hypothetical protein